ncbi:hypothetical protein M378DRAFT_164497 [Amanita muscaria Koide BX008]|uniref:Uncharacterized protein n=1 Tax=Amanita muscaria (strain Koide BX008) TaxID=946122 RepID=A0A0C2T9S8_AMAMK|nr:hypothetical protein M378DRAFT_164497 [Amanita muscaria Koide BX008]
MAIIPQRLLSSILAPLLRHDAFHKHLVHLLDPCEANTAPKYGIEPLEAFVPLSTPLLRLLGIGAKMFPELTLGEHHRPRVGRMS